LAPDRPHPDVPAPTEQFVRLFLTNQRRFYGLILSLVGRAADAEDVLQEVAAVMWRKFADYRAGTDFAAWGLRIARLETMNFVRKRRRAGFVTFDDALVDALADELMVVVETADEQSLALEECVRKLPAKSRVLIELRYAEGATPQAIAERLGRSADSVYKALTRVHALLMACIEGTLARGLHG
jgi:RNA polymerase sigma-70 factor (ECF subfamily)